MWNNHTAIIINHGCKLNQYEGESIEYSLEKSGFRIVDLKDGVKPDVVVVNTCTVTSRSDRKSRNSILRASRLLGKKGLLVVTGCYAQTDRDELKKLTGVNIVVGSMGKAALPDIIGAHFSGHSSSVDNVPGPFDYEVPVTAHRSRAFIKVQDGCNMACAYCKVVLARGSSVSRDPQSVVQALNHVHRHGYREVVLTGVNIASYSWEKMTLENLVAHILKNTPDTLRIRLSSIEPENITDALLHAFEHRRIMPHFHIPLQSGSDMILKRMNRPYTAEEYVRKVNVLRRIKPGSHVATDIIVGFPGEREEDFNKTLRVVERVQFASLHVFRYSPRDGTAASMLRDDVTQEEKAERSRKLIATGTQLNSSFRKRFEGTVRAAVLERKTGGYEGITDNYIRVQLPDSNEDLSRKLVPVRILSVEKDNTTGCIV
jgi:threonylcarbamoyladenosine tRNA methylthiotransferase MtaB